MMYLVKKMGILQLAALLGLARSQDACTQYHSFNINNLEGKMKLGDDGHQVKLSDRYGSATIPIKSFVDDKWCILLDATILKDKSYIGI